MLELRLAPAPAMVLPSAGLVERCERLMRCAARLAAAGRSGGHGRSPRVRPRVALARVWRRAGGGEVEDGLRSGVRRRRWRRMGGSRRTAASGCVRPTCRVARRPRSLGRTLAFLSRPREPVLCHAACLHVLHVLHARPERARMPSRRWARHPPDKCLRARCAPLTSRSRHERVRISSMDRTRTRSRRSRRIASTLVRAGLGAPALTSLSLHDCVDPSRVAHPASSAHAFVLSYPAPVRSP